MSYDLYKISTNLVLFYFSVLFYSQIIAFFSFPLFHHENFYIYIGIQVVEVMQNLVEKVRVHQDVDTTFLSNNIGQFCLRGKTGMY